MPADTSHEVEIDPLSERCVNSFIIIIEIGIIRITVLLISVWILVSRDTDLRF